MTPGSTPNGRLAETAEPDPLAKTEDAEMTVRHRPLACPSLHRPHPTPRHWSSDGLTSPCADGAHCLVALDGIAAHVLAVYVHMRNTGRKLGRTMMCNVYVLQDDHTAADYYFDSYAHFGALSSSIP